LIPRFGVRRAGVDEIDIRAGKKTVETVFGLRLSPFTAINRGVNEKVSLTAFRVIQLRAAIRDAICF
jgi:hypothetical protein